VELKLTAADEKLKCGAGPEPAPSVCCPVVRTTTWTAWLVGSHGQGAGGCTKGPSFPMGVHTLKQNEVYKLTSELGRVLSSHSMTPHPGFWNYWVWLRASCSLFLMQPRNLPCTVWRVGGCKWADGRG